MLQSYSYSIEQYKAIDRDSVFGLMQEIFVSEKMRKSDFFNLDLWKWQYENNPFGQAVTILAKHNSKVIGQYANIPLRLKLNGKLTNSALVIDLMVKDSYRRKGLFKMMGDASNRKLAASDFSLSMAFPSRQESELGFINKLGWFRVSGLNVLWKPVVPAIKRQRYQDITISPVREFPEEVNILWEEMKNNINVGVVRNRDYLNWRFFRKPKEEYQAFLVHRGVKLAGYFVVKIDNISKIKLGLIVDMLCLNELEIIKSAIRKISDLCITQGAYLCVILRTRLYENILRETGFRSLPNKLSPKNYSLIVKAHKEDLDLSALKNIDNWYLTFGDWDVV